MNNLKSSEEIKSLSPIVFFDGVCGLCNHFIDFLFRKDKHDIFKVSPLQGELAKQLLEPQLVENEFKSIILRDAVGIHQGSTAVLRILARLGGIWRVLSWLQLLPEPFRDFFYYLVARNRYRIFGKKESCRIPTPEERVRFLP